MKSVIKYCRFAAALGFIGIVGASGVIAQATAAGPDQLVIDAFKMRANDYVELRKRQEKRLPKIPKKATPKQIEAHKAALLTSVQNVRKGAKQGDIFTPEASRVIREIIKTHFHGKDRVELRKSVFEAENKAVPVRANFPYPESQELVEMPPSLLLVLPELPPELRYRFVGSHMLLVDRDNHLIIDYLTNAVP